MASAKTAMLTFHIEPELKEAVRTAAVNEHRNVTLPQEQEIEGQLSEITGGAAR